MTHRLPTRSTGTPSVIQPVFLIELCAVVRPIPKISDASITLIVAIDLSQINSIAVCGIFGRLALRTGYQHF